MGLPARPKRGGGVSLFIRGRGGYTGVYLLDQSEAIRLLYFDFFCHVLRDIVHVEVTRLEVYFLVVLLAIAVIVIIDTEIGGRN